MNNGGWQIFRPVSDRRDLLAIPAWPYARLAECWGGWGRKVDSVRELRESLAEAAGQKRFAVIEVVVPPQDLSPVSRKYIGASAAHAGMGGK
jgi:thiamine pyrophosphate-dependent acetolactate synthase large subunit-like protein